MENNSKYTRKKQQMKAGSYHGNSPFFTNINEFKNLHSLKSYDHLRKLGKFRFPSEQAERQMNKFNNEELIFE